MKNTSDNIERVIKENQQIIDHLENYKENYNQRIKSTNYFDFILNKATKKTQESFRKELENAIFKILTTKEQQAIYRKYYKIEREVILHREITAAYKTEKDFGIYNNISIVERIFRQMMNNNPLKILLEESTEYKKLNWGYIIKNNRKYWYILPLYEPRFVELTGETPEWFDTKPVKDLTLGKLLAKNILIVTIEDTDEELVREELIFRASKEELWDKFKFYENRHMGEPRTRELKQKFNNAISHYDGDYEKYLKAFDKYREVLDKLELKSDFRQCNTPSYQNYMKALEAEEELRQAEARSVKPMQEVMEEIFR